MKKSYLKLRYLVDSGCIFVGHDLRHDFKSINIIVPPQQVGWNELPYVLLLLAALQQRFGLLLGTEAPCMTTPDGTDNPWCKVCQQLTDQPTERETVYSIHHLNSARGTPSVAAP